MSGSGAFGGGCVETRLRIESKSLSISRRKLRMQITVKLLLVLTKSPPHVRPESAFISWLRRRTELPNIFTGKILRGTKRVKKQTLNARLQLTLSNQVLRKNVLSNVKG